ncbi:shikimate dehydrogenase [Methanosphaerula subterraneus]|uniref:shikimate dehydrogenase n=1 Tax=Methanosphaerula subterraneus TaxID=3350244 RepID=UPI003F841B99
MRIVLTGLRGTGKTLVGAALADLYHLPLIDTDERIEQEAGMAIPEIFAAEGEEGFRRREEQVVAGLPAGQAVISTGGGVLLSQRNLVALRRGSRMVLLTADLETMYRRTCTSDRPPLTGKPLVDEIRTVAAARRDLYRAAADICVDTTGKEPGTVALEVRALLNETWRTEPRAGALSFLLQANPAEREREALAADLKSDPELGLCGIAGFPASHSISPQMYAALFARFNLDYRYTRIEWPSIAEIVGAFRAGRLRGLSVTIPFKEQVIPLLDTVDPDATAIGAVNTVVRCGDDLAGFNTDWLGVSAPLQQHRGEKAVLIGAGGAAAAAAYALKHLGMDLTILNRTEERGRALADRCGCSTAPLSVFRDLAPEVVVHATPVGMHPDTGTLLTRADLDEGMTVFDLVYTPRMTPLLVEAEAAGARVIPGTEMFVHQACAQFEHFTGIRVSPDLVREVIE